MPKITYPVFIVSNESLREVDAVCTVCMLFVAALAHKSVGPLASKMLL